MFSICTFRFEGVLLRERVVDFGKVVNLNWLKKKTMINLILNQPKLPGASLCLYP